MLWAGTAQAAVVHEPLKSNLTLKPGEAYTLTIDATEVAEIGWRAVQAKECTTNCVETTELTAAIHTSMATKLGASRKYTPLAGRISIAYKNVSTDPVTIDVYRVKRTCDAEACKFLDMNDKGTWLVFKIDEFKSITTSKDGSYSVISGVAMSGRAFTIKAVWWTDEKNPLGANCSNFVKRYLDNHTPKDQYRPYILSGHAVGDPKNIVLTGIDTCVPKAPNYGVPEKNVYK